MDITTVTVGVFVWGLLFQKRKKSCSSRSGRMAMKKKKKHGQKIRGSLDPYFKLEIEHILPIILKMIVKTHGKRSTQSRFMMNKKTALAI